MNSVDLLGNKKWYKLSKCKHNTINYTSIHPVEIGISWGTFGNSFSMDSEDWPVYTLHIWTLQFSFILLCQTLKALSCCRKEQFLNPAINVDGLNGDLDPDLANQDINIVGFQPFLQ